MLSLPEKYKKNAPITKVTFVRRASLAGAEKKRFETSVEEIRLMYQIEGFDIPNLVNDDYNCQVIMFLRIRIKDLKQSSFISKIVQRIAPGLMTDYLEVKQDAILANNQSGRIRCGDNGIFKGVPVTDEQKRLTAIAKQFYFAFEKDGKYILDLKTVLFCFR